MKEPFFYKSTNLAQNLKRRSMVSIEIKGISYKAPGKFEEGRHEKIHNVVFEDSSTASIAIANEIAELIRSKDLEGKPCILGLATGSSPIKVYEELVRLHIEEELSFKNVLTFNLDEYYPMKKDSVHSYYYFMHQHLFNHIDIPPENINIPNGEEDETSLKRHCLEYEEKITQLGGLDFQLLGIGRTGHIGFNEPGSNRNSVTREITLDHITREDAATSFQGIENVPRTAITMGVETIRRARRIVLMAWGQNKAIIVKKTIEGVVNTNVPATYLQEFSNVTLVLDKQASSQLTRVVTPWLVGACEWNSRLTFNAVVWLSRQVRKPVLHLTDKDYNEHGMSDLLVKNQGVYNLNIQAFNKLQHAITGWPGGKPNADDANRPERAEPTRKRILVFSVHPIDELISMGGTLDRLVSQGHEVHLIYQTSGSIGVSDLEVLKTLEMGNRIVENKEFDNAIANVLSKTDNGFDSKAIRRIKASIRRVEGLVSSRFIGIPDENVHFLDLPFYDTGSIKKKPVSDKDYEIMFAIINRIKPHQIFTADGSADPHGTQKACYDLLSKCLATLQSESFIQDCRIWLYKAGHIEWDISEINMAVPMSPDQVINKRKAILLHQSQKDEVMYQGVDSKRFWIKTEDKNSETAEKYKALGLASYAAIEAFVRYDLRNGT